MPRCVETKQRLALVGLDDGDHVRVVDDLVGARHGDGIRLQGKRRRAEHEVPGAAEKQRRRRDDGDGAQPQPAPRASALLEPVGETVADARRLGGPPSSPICDAGRRATSTTWSSMTARSLLVGGEGRAAASTAAGTTAAGGSCVALPCQRREDDVGKLGDVAGADGEHEVTGSGASSDRPSRLLAVGDVARTGDEVGDQRAR